MQVHQLGLTSAYVSGVEGRVSNVEAVQEVSDEALQSQSIAAVRAAAELALIRVPVVGVGVDAGAFVAVQQLIQLPNPHGATDDFADARQKDVHLSHVVKDRSGSGQKG